MIFGKDRRGDANKYCTYAAELVTHAPDVLLAAGGTAVGALQRVTRDVPPPPSTVCLPPSIVRV
jgi:hypothetical protein